MSRTVTHGDPQDTQVSDQVVHSKPSDLQTHVTSHAPLTNTTESSNSDIHVHCHQQQDCSATLHSTAQLKAASRKNLFEDNRFTEDLNDLLLKTRVDFYSVKKYLLSLQSMLKTFFCSLCF